MINFGDLDLKVVGIIVVVLFVLFWFLSKSIKFLLTIVVLAVVGYVVWSVLKQ